MKVFTEIALALAVTCCGLLMLALLSFGVGCQIPSDAGQLENAVTAVTPPREAKGADAQLQNIVIHFQGRFFDTDLAPLTPEEASAQAAGAEPVLAVDPALPLAEILLVQALFLHPSPQLLPLPPEWQTALQARVGVAQTGEGR